MNIHRQFNRFSVRMQWLQRELESDRLNDRFRALSDDRHRTRGERIDTIRRVVSDILHRGGFRTR